MINIATTALFSSYVLFLVNDQLFMCLHIVVYINPGVLFSPEQLRRKCQELVQTPKAK